MSYQTISQISVDDNFIRYSGYRQNNACIRKYFSQDTINLISKKVTELLQGVDTMGRNIIVPDETITGIMSEIYNSFRPNTGDIYSRYIVPNNEDDYVTNMIDQVIEIITSNVRNTLGMEENNAKLSVWTTVLGTMNEHGLRSHSEIGEIRKKNTSHRGVVSFMNY